MRTPTIHIFTVAALALALAGNASAQAPATASSVQRAEGNTPDSSAPNVSICYEAFSLPIAKAGELQRKGMTDEELYKEVLAAGKLERLLVLRTKSAHRPTVTNVTNYIYPIEFIGPQLPVPKSPKDPQTPLPVAPTAFEKLDVGDTMDVEPTVSADGKSVEFQIVVGHVALAGREKWGKELTELEQPQFETRKLSTNLTASVGSPRLVGTLNPPFGNGLSARTEQHVWFCFITSTIARSDARAPEKARR